MSVNNPGQALVFLEAAAPYELGTPPQFLLGTMYPAYIRGQAQLMARHGAAGSLGIPEVPRPSGYYLKQPAWCSGQASLSRTAPDRTTL